MHARLTLSDLPKTMHLYVLKHANDDEEGSKGSAQNQEGRVAPMPPLDTISPACVAHPCKPIVSLQKSCLQCSFPRTAPYSLYLSFLAQWFQWARCWSEQPQTVLATTLLLSPTRHLIA